MPLASSSIKTVDDIIFLNAKVHKAAVDHNNNEVTSKNEPMLSGYHMSHVKYEIILINNQPNISPNRVVWEWGHKLSNKKVVLGVFVTTPMRYHFITGIFVIVTIMCFVFINRFNQVKTPCFFLEFVQSYWFVAYYGEEKIKAFRPLNRKIGLRTRQ